MSRFTYLTSGNANYIDELFEQYSKNPDSVEDSWKYFFDGLELGAAAFKPGASRTGPNTSTTTTTTGAKVVSLQVVSAEGQTIDLSSEAKVAELISAYRDHGHLIAHLDPLSQAPTSHPLLDLSRFQLAEKDLERVFTAGKLLGMGAAKLSEIIKRLKDIYCSSVGVQFTHISDPVAREWLREKMETSTNREVLTKENQRFILSRLTESEAFERFIHTRYVAQKRFSLEGGESLIPGLDRMIEAGADSGANNVVMGMAHRGRLNVLVNIFGKRPEVVFSEFEDNYKTDGMSGEGDVKYHKGYSADIVTRKGHPVHISLAHNPSHLEFVCPVVEGIARAKQLSLKDRERTKVIPILIHGDAAFAGQGVIYETLNLSQIRGFWTGGSIHVVINNQVGFTTDPIDARSTLYSTDVAKMLEVPIFHVNGDDAEAMWYASNLCIEYRQKFKKDVFIDLICYRKFGHNEGDEPAFTQPLMYKKIKEKPTVPQIYAQKLIAQGTLTEDESRAMVDQVIDRLSEAQKITKSEKPTPYTTAYTNQWQGFHPGSEQDNYKPVATAVSATTLTSIADKINQFPSGFDVHPKLKRLFDARLEAVRTGKGIDWGNGETLAYATLLLEGHTIRISGQDVERGTFSHRHAVLHDYQTGKTYVPLSTLSQEQGNFVIYNSLLSEQAVLGFEYGWSLADPRALVIWEAQFGDFANGAQVIIDQFIASSESKWQRASGIVLLLPHGYEGQGPEHSSARLERFLQLSGKNNICVCNVSTPAQIFHALRRQQKRDFRKPLVVMSPKSLLRHPQAVSNLSEFTDEGFKEIIDDSSIEVRAQARKVVLCSGKIYYDILAEREARGIKDVALIRVEQLYPWHTEEIARVLNQYTGVDHFTWLQEEPRNMGSWTYVFGLWHGGLGQFSEKVGNRPLKYVGRDIGAAPAVGSHKLHGLTQKEIIEKALSS